VKRMEWGLKPYSDGSGFEYTVSLTEENDAIKLSIKSAGGEVWINGEDWQDVSGMLNDLYRFALGGKPRERVAALEAKEPGQ
jgi:hypothetical protein